MGVRLTPPGNVLLCVMFILIGLLITQFFNLSSSQDMAITIAIQLACIALFTLNVLTFVKVFKARRNQRRDRELNELNQRTERARQNQWIPSEECIQAMSRLEQAHTTQTPHTEVNRKIQWEPTEEVKPIPKPTHGRKIVWKE